MKSQLEKLVIALILIVIFASISPSVNVLEKKGDPSEEKCINESVIKLKYDIQKLWIEHAWWTRSVIVSHIGGLDDKDKVLERLLRNQVDLGNLIKPYYGEEAGSNLIKLLKEQGQRYTLCRSR